MDLESLLALFQANRALKGKTGLFTPYLSLNKPYATLLAKLGNPQNHLPPVFHIAGTNGKGSTTAFLRALAEAAGKKAHVYTSPHLVRYTERIRIAGAEITEEAFAALLLECAKAIDPKEVSVFEATTAAALAAFARTPADVTLLEVGLGGRLDATNVVGHPAATLITRLSYDHRDYLGETLLAIAREKAGIMRTEVPCYSFPQPDLESKVALRRAAEECSASLLFGDTDWKAQKTDKGFTFSDAKRTWTLPPPALLGDHQYQNAGLALAASASFPFPVTEAAAAKAMTTVTWPARLQRLDGLLQTFLPEGSELWLDGGHNDSAGEVLAHQMRLWKEASPGLPIYVICGMISTKKPLEFIGPFASYVSDFRGIAIRDEPLSQPAETIVKCAKMLGLSVAQPSDSLTSALSSFKEKARVLICGSLYLAGKVLEENI